MLQRPVNLTGVQVGNEAVPSLFPRIKDEFCLEIQGGRCIILLLVVYLFNYRINLLECNQVWSTFMPYLEANALQAN
jgi:hypothetical protein